MQPAMATDNSWAASTLTRYGPGFKRIVIRPYALGELTWVRAEYNSPYA
jgi:hypothetical protein